MSTRESNKIRTFPETTIYGMEYFITADLRKKPNKIVRHLGISDAPHTKDQEMLTIATQQNKSILKVNDRNTRKRRKICSKLTKNTQELRH